MQSEMMKHPARNGLLTITLAIGAAALTACTTQVGSGAGGGQSTSGTGGGPSCSSFLDAHGTAIQLHITNHRANPVGFSSTCPSWSGILDAAGAPRSTARSLNIGTCENDQQAGGAVYGDCMDYNLVQIAPGATHDEVWGGVFHNIVSMPAACLKFKGDDVQCDQAVIPEGGAMTFVVGLTDVVTSETVKATKAFVFGTDTSIDIDVN